MHAENRGTKSVRAIGSVSNNVNCLSAMYDIDVDVDSAGNGI